MNKKIIALAVAAAFTAPVAMADMKISGRVNQQFVNVDTDGGTSVMNNTDNGHQRLQFDVTAGNAYGRLALDERYGRDNGAAAGADSRTKRDQYVGYKFGGGTSLQYGRMANSGKNIEKDPLIATFLETRSSVASARPGNAYSSSSFVNEIAQLSMKAGAATIKVQMGLSSNDVAAAGVAGDASEGYTAFSVSGKAGAVRYWLAWNNDAADGTATGTTNDDTNTKFGASMKFGKVATALNFETYDNNGTETEAITVRANMGFGNGLKGYAAIALRSADGGSANDATWLRLAVAKKLSKGVTLYGGYTSTDYDAASASSDVSTIGAGMTIKF